jgi:hypothetical protein
MNKPNLKVVPNVENYFDQQDDEKKLIPFDDPKKIIEKHKDDDNRSIQEIIDLLEREGNRYTCSKCGANMRKLSHKRKEHSTRSFEYLRLFECMDEKCGEWILQGHSIDREIDYDSYSAFYNLTSHYNANRDKFWPQHFSGGSTNE